MKKQTLSATAAEKYVRLTQQFRQQLKVFPSVREFTGWISAVGRQHVSIRRYSQLRNGQSVPMDAMSLFSEYISDTLKLGRYPVSAIAESAGPPPRQQDGHKFPSGIDVDALGWTALVDFLRTLFGSQRGAKMMPDSAYCHNEADVAFASKVVLRCLGRSSSGEAGKTLSDIDAEKVGSGLMRKGIPELADWLRMLLLVNPCTVMFATIPQGRNGHERVGASVVIPVSGGAYARLRVGALSFLQLTEGDLVYQSETLHVSGMADIPYSGTRGRTMRSFAQAHTCMYQIASVSTRFRTLRDGLCLLGMVAVPQNEKRLRLHGFCDVGTNAVDPVAGWKLVELSPPRHGTTNPWWQPVSYRSLMGFIWGYQEVFKQVIMEDHRLRNS